jgi:hypothetical protein
MAADITGLVAAMTESDLSSVALAKEELDAVGERAYTTSLVDRDSSTRWQAVWRFSLSRQAFSSFVAEKPTRRLKNFGTAGAMVGV